MLVYRYRAEGRALVPARSGWADPWVGQLPSLPGALPANAAWCQAPRRVAGAEGRPVGGEGSQDERREREGRRRGQGGGNHLGTRGWKWGATRGPRSEGCAHLAQCGFQLPEHLFQAVHPLSGSTSRCTAWANSRLAIALPPAGVGTLFRVPGGLPHMSLSSGGLLSPVQGWSLRTRDPSSSLLWAATPYLQSLQNCPFLLRHPAAPGLGSRGHYAWQGLWAIPAPLAASQGPGSWGGSQFFKPVFWWGGRVRGTLRQDDPRDAEGFRAWSSLGGEER